MAKAALLDYTPQVKPGWRSKNPEYFSNPAKIAGKLRLAGDPGYPYAVTSRLSRRAPAGEATCDAPGDT